MCTALTYKNNDFYFGRNLDLDYDFNQKVTITPKEYTFNLKNGNEYKNKYALIGMATVIDDYPLYAEACNECGLAMAGLNFPFHNHYKKHFDDKINIAPYEFIPYILGSCKDIKEAKSLLKDMELVDIPFKENVPNNLLHYIIADENESIVVEHDDNGIIIYDNPYGVLTNNPPFNYHLENIKNYMYLSSHNAKNNLSESLDLKPYAEGMGALGLPGDMSSSSRFIKTVFNKYNVVSNGDENSNIVAFFNLLDAVKMVKGTVVTASERYDITTYSSCINCSKGLYYYKTYNNPGFNLVDLHKENINGDSLIIYELNDDLNIFKHN